MPRKKPIDAVDVILQYAEEAPIADVDLIMKLVRRIVGKRSGQVVTSTPRKRRSAPSAPAAPEPAAPPPTAATPRPATRRMRANSPRPKNEATPIVPLQATVGDGDDTNDNTGD